MKFILLFSVGQMVWEKTCQNNLIIAETGYMLLLHHYKRLAYYEKLVSAH